MDTDTIIILGAIVYGSPVWALAVIGVGKVMQVLLMSEAQTQTTETASPSK